jgi:hypothetical protein
MGYIVNHLYVRGLCKLLTCHISKTTFKTTLGGYLDNFNSLRGRIPGYICGEVITTNSLSGLSRLFAKICRKAEQIAIDHFKSPMLPCKINKIVFNNFILEHLYLYLIIK